MTLTSEQIAFFQENGYLILEKLFTEEELEALRRRAEWIASGEAPHIPEQFRQVEPRVAQGELAADDYVLSLRKLSHNRFGHPQGLNRLRLRSQFQENGKLTGKPTHGPREVHVGKEFFTSMSLQVTPSLFASPYCWVLKA